MVFGVLRCGTSVVAHAVARPVAFCGLEKRRALRRQSGNDGLARLSQNRRVVARRRFVDHRIRAWAIASNVATLCAKRRRFSASPTDVDCGLERLCAISGARKRLVWSRRRFVAATAGDSSGLRSRAAATIRIERAGSLGAKPSIFAGTRNFA